MPRPAASQKTHKTSSTKCSSPLWVSTGLSSASNPWDPRRTSWEALPNNRVGQWLRWLWKIAFTGELWQIRIQDTYCLIWIKLGKNSAVISTPPRWAKFRRAIKLPLVGEVFLKTCHSVRSKNSLQRITNRRAISRSSRTRRGLKSLTWPKKPISLSQNAA